MRATPRTFALALLLLAVPFASVQASCMGDEPVAAKLDASTGPEASTTASPEAGDPDATRPDGAAPREVDTPFHVAGSRLRPAFRRLVGADGALLLEPNGWFDETRQETCYFRTLSDGKLHCIPDVEEPYLLPTENFQDAACTKGVIGFLATEDPRDGKACTAPRFEKKKRYAVVTGPRGSCGTDKVAEFPRDADRLAITRVYRPQADGSCAPVELNGRVEIFSVTGPLTEISPSSFTTVTSSDDTPTTADRLRISTTRFTGEDGSVDASLRSIVDNTRNEFCRPELSRGGVTRCLPYGEYAYPGTDFADNTCTTPTIQVSRTSICDRDARVTNSKYIMEYVPETCGELELRSNFSSPPLSTVFVARGPTCAIMLTSPSTAIHVGPLPPVLDPSQWARLEPLSKDAPPRFYSRSGSRLVAKVDGHKDGAFERTNPPYLFDRELGDRCEVVTLQDGKAHCVAGAAGVYYSATDSIYFVDSSCTERVTVADNEAKTVACGARPAKFLFDKAYNAGGCQTIRVYEKPAQKLTTGNVFTMSGGACVPAQLDLERFDAYRASDLKVAEPSRFVELTISLTK